MHHSRSRSPMERRSLTKHNQCAECKREFSSQTNLRRHSDEQHRRREKIKFYLPVLPQSFVRKHDLDRHWQSAHRENPSSTSQPANAGDQESEVPRIPGRNSEDDMVSLSPGSVECGTGERFSLTTPDGT